MTWVLLSHWLAPNGPTWPGAPTIELVPNHQMSRGDIANTTLVTLYNHYGTHVDAPSHFNPDGSTLSDLGAEDFVFERPRMVHVPLEADQLIGEEVMHELPERCHDADLLLIRSGFEDKRADTSTYAEHGPGFTPEGARTLLARLPNLRAIAIDWMSLAAYQFSDEGAHAHTELLGRRQGDRSVLIFEDVHLAALEGRTPRRVFACPLLIEGIDGAPCTILAEVE